MAKKVQSLYIHFPFCRHLCNYCDFFKKVPQNAELEQDEFHLYLENAFTEHEKLMKENGYSWDALETLYIGGGTPSLWGEKGAEFLARFLKEKNIQLSPECEFTLEVNPGSWTKESLLAWKKTGVNRYSLGIQTLNGQVIKYLDRVHTIDDVFETLTYFKEINANFSVDFMLGLPHSEVNQRNVIEELELALKFNPSHFSVYILTVKENYKYFNHLPNEEWIEKEYLDVAQFLTSHKFSHYEVSNFGLENRKSKHNLMYWKSNSVAALGPSATGFFSEDRIRYKWKTKNAQIETEMLSLEEFKLEQIYMALRSEEGLLASSFSNQAEFLQLKEKWEGQNYLVKHSSKIQLNSHGYLILDSLMDELFRLKLA